MRIAISRFLQQKLLLIFVFLFLGEGIFFTVFYWIQPSAEINARLYGYLFERMLIGSTAFLVLAGFALAATLYFRRTQFHRKLNAFVLEKLSIPGIRRLLLFLSVAAILSLGEYLFDHSFHKDAATLSTSIYLLISPMVIWAILSILEGAGFLAWTCLRVLNPRVSKKEIVATVLVSFTAILVIWQWATLVFRLNWHYFFGEIVWQESFTSYFPLHYIIFIGWGLAAIALLRWIRKNGFRKIFLLILLAWGFIGQLAIPIRDVQHIGDTLTRYQNAAISQILPVVCTENPGYIQILSHYEKYEGGDFWLGTKPPGYFLSYTALAGTVAKLSKVSCQQSLPAAILFIFPLLAALTLLPISRLAKVLYKTDGAFTSVLLFTLPSMLFFALIADQAWYPLLFITSVWLTIETTRRSNYLMAAFLGILLYLDIFISFSLLPAAGFTAVWFLISWLIGSREERGKLVKQALLVLSGFMVVYALLRIFSGYDPWLRYQNAFASHREIKNFSSGIGDLFSYIFLNNFEFFFFIGFPIGALFLVNVVSGFRDLLRRTFTLPVLFSVSAGMVFLILNLIGQTRGETARLWLFMTPMVVLLAGERLRRLPTWAQDALVGVQLITIMLIFQYYYTL